MAVCPDVTVQMMMRSSGWQTEEGESAYEKNKKTTSLAAQRYVYVCCPVGTTIRRRLCTMRGAVWVIGGVYAAAVLSQACRLAELTFSSVRVPSLVNFTGGNQTAAVTACLYELTPFIERYEVIYFNVYYWSRVLFIHVIPCSALVFLNASLVRTMRAAHQRRCQMISRVATTSESHRLTVTEVSASQFEMLAF